MACSVSHSLFVKPVTPVRLRHPRALAGGGVWVLELTTDDADNTDETPVSRFNLSNLLLVVITVKPLLAKRIWSATGELAT